jgi:RNA-binding protein NOB1
VAPASAATPVGAEAETKEEAATEKDDGDDGEGAWITPANLHKQIRPPVKPTEPESTIAVITTDYAMQNVLLQLGLRLLNLRGRSIRSIRNWQKKCHACGTLSPDMSREFCSACGGHTMIRVNVTVNKAGLVRYWHGSRHLNLRGTIYSIPMPRAGRHANNLKLSEDVIDERIRKGGGLMGRTGDGGKARGEKTPSQLFDDGIEFGLGKTGPNSNDHVFGYGRKNPNAKGPGGKKKGKK